MSTEGVDYKFEAQTTLDPHLCDSVHAVKFSSEKVQTSLFSHNEMWTCYICPSCQGLGTLAFFLSLNPFLFLKCPSFSQETLKY